MGSRFIVLFWLESILVVSAELTPRQPPCRPPWGRMARGVANRSSRNLQATLRSREHNARCQEHFHNFVAWARAFDDQIGVRRPSARVANKLLVDYIQFLYDDKRSLTHAVYTVVGIQNHYHQLRRQLRPAWDSILSWKLEEPVSLRIPVPGPVCEALFRLCLLFAFVKEPHRSREWFDLGLGIRLGFHGMLRPGEFCNAHKRCLVLPRDSLWGFGDKCVFAVERPKTRSRGSRIQFTVIEDSHTIKWLDWATANMAPHDEILVHSTSTFRTMFKVLLLRVGIDTRFTPAGLRAGGATHRFMQGTPIPTLKFLGRWKSLDSLEHYVQEAASLCALSELSPSTTSLLSDLLAGCEEELQPPLAPASAFLPQRVRRRRRRL